MAERKVCVDGAGVVPGAGVAVTSPQLRNFAVHSIRQCGINRYNFCRGSLRDLELVDFESDLKRVNKSWKSPSEIVRNFVPLLKM